MLCILLGLMTNPQAWIIATALVASASIISYSLKPPRFQLVVDGGAVFVFNTETGALQPYAIRSGLKLVPVDPLVAP